ncbi:AAA family ATPase [Candidatus Formimonas warabiya]|uniref:AAA family ATPase n=1 Tax=Formimonas warabiya TaxID=1761012 RepID=A0A3G1KXA0_FORW1|nr:AAA family ATPase [Candidatus Formimonas warabiya]ATW27086.1 AAA family ATPase [Candidatus Formimonas warabiya]
MPFLKNILFDWEGVPDKNIFPFNIPSIKGLSCLQLKSNVTFFIGENGSGKSTLLEAIALKCGFKLMGGGSGTLLSAYEDAYTLEHVIRLSWMPKIKTGFFLRAETFYDYANYIDDLAKDPDNDAGEVYRPYGGKSLHQQSHGESFISLFMNRFKKRGVYLLDEPEAALSPQRQLAFLRIMRQLDKSDRGQFIIATHAPILMAYPGATLLNFDVSPLAEIAYEDTAHFYITKRFLNHREHFLRELFHDEEEG